MSGDLTNNLTSAFTGPQGSFSDWTDRLHAYGEYIGALGQYKLTSAQAEVETAKAAQEWIKADAMEAVCNQLKLEISRLNHVRAVLDKEIDRLQVRTERVKLLLRGSPIVQFELAWAAFAGFLIDALAEDMQPSLYQIPVPDSTRHSSNYIRRDTQANTPLPATIINAVAFCNWLRANHLTARLGTPAHEFLSHIIGVINSVPARGLAGLRTRIASIQAGTYDGWHPASVSGIPVVPSVAARIEQASLPE